MTWNLAFALANLLAVACWLALLLLPRRPAILAAVLYGGVGLLSLAYALLFAGLNLGLLDPQRPDGGVQPGMDYSIDGLIDLFSARGVMAVGWIHYLAFDLFVGLWIAKDADAKGMSRLVQAPVLLATFLAGPLGLAIWLGLRERRARRLHRRR